MNRGTWSRRIIAWPELEQTGMDFANALEQKTGAAKTLLFNGSSVAADDYGGRFLTAGE